MLGRSRRHRRGASLVETAITLTVFLFLVLSALDLANAVSRRAAVSDAARKGARTAVVHGTLAPSGYNGGTWGPTAVSAATLASPPSGTATYLVSAVSGTLTGCPTGTTTVAATWPDGGTAVGDRVKVTVTSTYTPVITYLVGGITISLTASSTMPISH